MDILVELPTDQWPLLQEKLKKLWPFNMPGYYSLHMNLKYPTIKEAFKYKVYCPFGKVENGFVALCEKNLQEIFLFSITEDTSKIEEAVLKTKLIDWNKIVFFAMVTSVTIPAIERLRDIMQFETYDGGPCIMYHLDGSTSTITGLSLPNETYITSVKPEDIERVDKKWTYTSSYSYQYFTVLVSNGLSYALYSSETNELLAWVFVSESRFLCHLFCEEKHRKRGYGEYVVQCAVNDLLKDGNDVYAYVVGGNEKPLRLFTKFGFKAVDNSAFVITENPKNKPYYN